MSSMGCDAFMLYESMRGGRLDNCRYRVIIGLAPVQGCETDKEVVEDISSESIRLYAFPITAQK